MGKFLGGVVLLLIVGMVIGFAVKMSSNGADGVDPDATMDFQVYFSQGDMTDCSIVKGVARTVPESADIAEEAILSLLEGPTTDEIADGYITSINEETRLVDLEMSGDTMIATFSDKLQEGAAGSCMVTAIRAQIEQTLKQFPTVDEVVIKVQGVPDAEVLQP